MDQRLDLPQLRASFPEVVGASGEVTGGIRWLWEGRHAEPRVLLLQQVVGKAPILHDQVVTDSDARQQTGPLIRPSPSSLLLAQLGGTSVAILNEPQYPFVLAAELVEELLKPRSIHWNARSILHLRTFAFTG
ncbi:MAG: hypothetical protein KC731_30335 [Myxococcales bacterium]|nr:hypothetical protein [Myxococcales bacterium]